MDQTSAGREGRLMSVSMVAAWRIARNLFPIYAELARKSQQNPPPFSSFGADDRPESLEAVRRWFDAVDASCPAQPFRERLEEILGANDTGWHTVAMHFLTTRRIDAESRSKLRYALTRYFVISCPPSFRSKDVALPNVAEVLQPLIGDCVDSSGSAPAEGLAKRIQESRTLAELVKVSANLERWEEGLGADYFFPTNLARSVYLHYLLHVFACERFETWRKHAATRLTAIQQRGVDALDCRSAGMGEKEPIEALVARFTEPKDAPRDVEYRLSELAPNLEAIDAVIADAERSQPDPRVEAELSALRTLAERLITQLSSVTQRLQRLESVVDLHNEWKPSAETMAATTKFRVTPPPTVSASTSIPIAARQQTRTTTEPQPHPPGHPFVRGGNGRS